MKAMRPEGMQGGCGLDGNRAGYARYLPWLLMGFVGLVSTACWLNDGLVDEGFSTRLQARSFFPATGPAMGGIPITITGENFREGMQVFFGVAPAAQVEVTSSGSATVMLPPGRYGPAQIRLRMEGEEVAFDVPFRYRAEETSLRFYTDLGWSDYDAAYGVGDVNGDGLNDVVVASAGDLALYLNGDDGLQPHSNHQIPTSSRSAERMCAKIVYDKYSLAMADFSGDGLSDVLLTVPGYLGLYRFEGTRDGGLRALAVEDDYPIDMCTYHTLIPAELNGDDQRDLVIINHDRGASSKASYPIALLQIGYVLSAWHSNRSAGLLEADLVFDRLHSFRLMPGTSGDELWVLADRESVVGSVELYLARFWLDGETVAADSSLILNDVAENTRYHLFDFQSDDGLDVVALHTPHPEGGFVSSSKQLTFARLDEATGALEIRHETTLSCGVHPLILSAEVMAAREGRELLLVCPRAGGPVYVLRTDKLGWTMGFDSHMSLKSPNYANTDETGFPLMPSLAVADINGDGVDELIAADYWSQTHLLHFNMTTDTHGFDMGSLSYLEPSEPGPSRSPYHSYPVVLHNGLPATMLVDLNRDGRPDLVKLFRWDDRGQLRITLLVSTDIGTDRQTHQISWSGEEDHHYYGRDTLLIGDLNGDDSDDFLIPRSPFDQPTVFDIVLSEGGGYTHSGSVDLHHDHVLLLANLLPDSSGNHQLVAVLEQMLASSMIQYRYDVKSYDFSLSEGFRERTTLVADLEAPSGIAHVLDLNGDDSLDLVANNGTICFGEDYQNCDRRRAGFRDVLGFETWSTTDLNVMDTDGNGLLEMVAVDNRGHRLVWIEFDGQQRTRHEISLSQPEGVYLHMTPETFCDLDGDGRNEVIAYGVLQGRDPYIISAVGRASDGQGLVWDNVGTSDLMIYDLACGDIAAGRYEQELGRLDDLLLYDSYFFYVVPNDSR